MAKSKKDKASKKALSYGNLYTQEAVTQFLTNFGKQPDIDGVLRKALLDELKRKYPDCRHQDASFQEYGFGATMVTIK